MKDEVEKLLEELCGHTAYRGYSSQVELDQATAALLAIFDKAQVEAVRAELESLLPEFEMVPMITGWQPFPWATMKPEDQAEAKMWQSIHAHAAYYYQQYIKDRLANLKEDGETK